MEFSDFFFSADSSGDENDEQVRDVPRAASLHPVEALLEQMEAHSSPLLLQTNQRYRYRLLLTLGSRSPISCILSSATTEMEKSFKSSSTVDKEVTWFCF